MPDNPELPMTPAPRTGTNAFAAWALAVALLALAAALVSWWEARERNAELKQTLGGKVAELATLNRDLAQRNDALGRELRDTQNRQAQTETRLTEIQAQRIALEEMTRELARAPDDWLLAEIEQTLTIASRELALAGNVRAAIAALTTVEQRLSRSDKWQAAPLRRAIVQDLERLRATPAPDTQGLLIKLDHLMSQALTMPLNLPDTTAATEEAAPARDAPAGFWRRLFDDFRREIRGLVRIREIGGNERALLSPSQATFVRENLRLRLLSARISAMARDDANFKEDVRAARELVAGYFDVKAKVNANAVATLKQMGENAISITPPDIAASLNAVRAARAARERPAR